MTGENGKIVKRQQFGRKPRGSVNFNAMSKEEKRAYRNATVRRFAERNPEKFKASVRRITVPRYFGITLERYNEIMTGAICTICTKKTKRMHLDHCHATGQLRAPLCHNCNIGLGNFKDNVGLLKRAIAYLEYFAKPS